MSKKLEKSKKKEKGVKVRVVNEPLNVGVAARPYLVTLFEAREISAQGSMMGPLGGLDLTGYSEYRLTLHLVGKPGTAFSIRELFGPAGSVDQVTFEIGDGQVGPQGILNYRATFEIFGPKNLFIQVSNHGDEPIQVDGTLYAVR